MFKTVNGKTMLEAGVYDFGKKAVQVYIPALSTLYFTLGSLWGLPAVTQVVGTLAAVAVFIGVVLGISSSQYDASGAAHDGDLNIFPKENGGLTYSFDFNGDPADLPKQDKATFKVVTVPTDPQATTGNAPTDQ